MKYAIDGRYVQDHFPGIGRYAYNLIDALARVAPEDSFVVLHNPALKNTHYDVAGLDSHQNVQLERIAVPTLSWREQVQFPRLDAALLHSPYYLKPYRLGIPTVVTLFDLLPIRVRSAVSAETRLFYNLAVRLAARSAARLITPSVSTRSDLASLLGIDLSEVHVIPLAADKRFAPQAVSEIARIRQKYALPKRYVLYVGINKPHKNLETLTRAWEGVKDSATLVIAGAWDERYPIQPADRTLLIPNIADADLPGLYAGATVFVFPSLYEGFGLPPLEAMACGVPVICSNASSLPEVVGDAALIFDPQDVHRLGELIGRVLEDSRLRQDLCGRSLARAARFSWEQTATETLQVYRQVGRPDA